MHSSSYAKLYTKESVNLSEIPHNVYPRPLLKRDSFICINGKWRFEARDRQRPRHYTKNIIVPFCPESLLSGLCEVYPENDYLFYKTKFVLPEGFTKDRVIVNFGAVDQDAEVYINGELAGKHIGGYESFSYEITQHLLPVNSLIVKVTDSLSNGILP